MRAMTIRRPGDLDNLVLSDRAEPVPGPGEVLVRVRACSLNYHDYVVAKGWLPVADGLVVLSDAAGEVVAVGPDVDTVAEGDTVISTFYPKWSTGPARRESTSAIPGDTVDGYARELISVPETWLTRSPAGLDLTEAATLPCAGLTAWRGVVVDGMVKPGDVVLTQGTGGVSLFALQFAKAAGATVIATSSSDEKLERLRKLGADHIINYRDVPEWGRAARQLTDGRGVDLVIEVGGSGTLAQSIDACGMNARIALIGVLSGVSGDMNVGAALTKQVTIKGLAVGSRTDQHDMIRAIETIGLRPVIDSLYPLDGLAAAFRHQEGGQHMGKICIQL
ncbi:zinc-dependent alcohol dehydrogenase family protein [Nocardia miyunensis]|uniref:zinc-dependent alcohol dehydrogenase family protein n=1 Tax=Nocardia miyunensis TaxID=282684 RepID=UPI000831E9EF|nr:NAD(P)-dependent alcohol dehydrogenase [Nocardia miyunensis]